MDEGDTVGALARRLGISVRTLHHYDAIGLVVPSGRTDAGYRVYAPADVQRLANVLAYRACGLSLADIARLLDDDIDRAAHLRHQLDLLDERLTALAAQREVLHRAWEAQQMGIDLDPEQIIEIFGDDDPTQYADEARDRWGDTDAYRQSHARTSAYGPEEWRAAREEWEQVTAEFASCLASGEPAAGGRRGGVASRPDQPLVLRLLLRHAGRSRRDVRRGSPVHRDVRRPGAGPGAVRARCDRRERDQPRLTVLP